MGQPNGGLSPKKLYLKARKEIKSIPDDEIYLICDVDDFTSELLEIKPQCAQNGYTLIISNSCFEVWLYYGKHSAKPDSHDIPFVCPHNRSKISQEFKTYLGAVVRGGVDPRKAIYDIEIAVCNAKIHYCEDEQGIPHLYCTNMFVLAERLLELIKPELEELRRKKQEEREKLKTKCN